MRNWITNLIMFGMAAALLWQFYHIAVYGSFVGAEPNTLILALEIALFLGIIIFAIINLTMVIRRRH